MKQRIRKRPILNESPRHLYRLAFLSPASLFPTTFPHCCQTPQVKSNVFPPPNETNPRQLAVHQHPSQSTMASAARSSLLRQSAAFAAPASRAMTSSTRTAPTLLSSVARTQLSRPSTAPAVGQITAFHVTSRRNLLPPGPRMFFHVICGCCF